MYYNHTAAVVHIFISICSNINSFWDILLKLCLRGDYNCGKIN